MPGATFDSNLALQTLRALDFETICLSGHVTKTELVSGIREFLKKVENEAKNHSSVIVLLAASCHGLIGPGEGNEFPEILASDYVSDASSGLDVGKDLIQKLNHIKVAEQGSLQVISIFDCCRASKEPTIWRSPSILRRGWWWWYGDARAASKWPLRFLHGVCL